MTVKQSLIKALDAYADEQPILCASIEFNGIKTELRSDFNSQDFNDWLDSLDVEDKSGPCKGVVWLEGGSYLVWMSVAFEHLRHWQYFKAINPPKHLIVA